MVGISGVPESGLCGSVFAHNKKMRFLFSPWQLCKHGYVHFMLLLLQTLIVLDIKVLEFEGEKWNREDTFHRKPDRERVWRGVVGIIRLRKHAWLCPQLRNQNI